VWLSYDVEISASLSITRFVWWNINWFVYKKKKNLMMAIYGRNMSFWYYYHECTSFISYELHFDYPPTHLWWSATIHPQKDDNILQQADASMMVQQIGSTSWPPQSPETTPLNFFLLGFVKDEVYVLPMPKTLDNLKDWTPTAIAKLNTLYCKVFGTKSNIILMCAERQMEYTSNLHRVLIKISELLFVMVCV
jgi:hypothetical protein